MNEWLEGAFEALSCSDGLGYQPYVAGLVISAQPGCLHPMPRAFVKDLPSWGGQDDPDKLTISEERWTLEYDGKIVLDFNPTERLKKLLYDKLAAAE